MRKLFIALLLLLAVSALVLPQQLGGSGKVGGTAKVAQAAAGGSAFAHDTFTDTDDVSILSHTPETGGSWAFGFNQDPNNGSIRSNRLYFDGGLVVAYVNTAPPSADYVVTCSFVVLDSTAISRVWCAGRIHATDLTLYGIEIDLNVPQVALRKAVAGSLTNLTTPDTSWTPVTNDVVDTELTMAGTTISGRFRVNGGSWVSLSNATDSAITAAGHAGIYNRTGTSLPAATNATEITAQ